MIPIGGLRVYG